MPELSNHDAALMRVRLDAANRVEHSRHAGYLSEAEFRNQIQSIGGPAARDGKTPKKEKPAMRSESETVTRDELDAAVRTAKESAKSDALKEMIGETRAYRQADGVPEIQGKPNEPLVRGQSSVEWVRRAAENGVQWQSAEGRVQPVKYYDNDVLNSYWGQRLGLAKPSTELRALGEDVTGSGLAITPQTWTASFIDYLYANAVCGALGVSRVAMATEIVNVPQFTSPVAPAWLAENSTIGLDASPAFSTVALNAGGGWKDITLYSKELAMDAYISGGLPGMLAQSMARKFALAIDLAAIYGITSSSVVAPGLINETGFVNIWGQGVTANTPAAPTDPTDFSKRLESIRALNDEPTGGILTNPQVVGTYARLNASTYAKWWDFSQDVIQANLNRFVYTTQLTATETATATTGAAPATTGGTSSSFFMGPWQRMMLGVHLDFSTMVLQERYVDMNQTGLYGFMRASVRTGHPEAFVRTTGISTT